MSDPVSIIAVAAAVGGMAGKVAERTWDSAERWLSNRFGSHALAVRNQAQANSAEFVQILADRVRVLEERREIDASAVEETERHPQFSALLQDTLLSAAQTNDREKHAILADIIALRLASDAETTAALAAPLAASAVARATSRQLRLMGLVCLIDEIWPSKGSTKEHFREWLSQMLEPFNDYEFYTMDALHLAAVACITFDPRSGRDLSTILNLKAVLLLKELVDLTNVRGFPDLQSNWDEGLAGVQLTSVGSIIGGLVFNQLTGATLQLPKWP